MRRALIFTVVIALVLGICLLAYLVFLRVKGKSPLPVLPLPPSPTIMPLHPPVVTPPQSIGDTITIGTTKGSVVVKNFYKSAVEVRDFGVLVRRTNEYDLVYFPGGSTFLMTISSQPVEAAVRTAEKEFIEVLGVNEQDACRLQVAITVPFSTDPAYAGKEYGLSFCIGQATPLGAAIL
jgi:hypothetical protein